MTTSAAQVKRDERNAALESLRAHLQPGDTIYTVLRHVSASGMQRRIDFYQFVPRERVVSWGRYGNEVFPYTQETRQTVEKWYLSGTIATALGLRCTDDGIVMGGCGYDAAYEVVNDLSMALFGDGYQLNKESIG